MRKRNVSHIADTIFWYVLYMFPIILTIVQNFSFANAGSVEGFDGFFQLLSINLISLGCNGNGIVANTLDDIFGEVGVLQLFNDKLIFGFAQWFVGVFLVHICVDFILFIPRFAHKWMKKATEED